MKKLVLAVLALALPAVVARAEIKKTHPVEVEVVKADVEGKSLTFKAEGAEKTAPCGPLTVSSLKRVKAGDKVTITCVDDGDPKACKEITYIKVPVAKPAK